MREKVTNLARAAALLAVTTTVVAQADSLDTWTKRASDVRPNLLGVAYGNGRYVCVGQSGVILVSTNGVTWLTNNSHVANDLRGIAFAEGQFLAVGSGGLILRSTNAASWLAQPSLTTNQLNGIARCDGHFIATGNQGTLLTSPDGIAWTPQTSGTSRALVASAFGNSLIVAVGQGQSNPGTVLTSSNGVNWVDRSALNLGVAFYGVAFGHGVFAAADARGVIYSSANGINWSNRWTVTSSDYVFGLTFAQNTFVGVGGPYSGGSQRIITSRDGMSWKSRPISITNSAALRAVTYGNGYFIAVGDKGLIVQSGPVSTLRIAGTTGEMMSLALDGEIGRTYRVQGCSELTASNWTDLLSITNTGEVTSFPDPQAGNSPLRFYRAVSP